MKKLKIKSHQKLPTKWEEREKLRDKGQFWTPSWVAEAMVSYFLKDCPSVIYDPATGRGSFFEALKNISNDTSILYRGGDIDEGVLSDPIYSNDRAVIENRDFIIHPPKEKFSSIVANPPYIRHHRINEETKTILKHLSKGITGFAIDGRAGYHIYFFLQALNALSNNGKLAFIMSADTCEGKFSESLWKWVTEKFCLECVVTFEPNATPFPDVDTNAVVFFISKKAQKKAVSWVKCFKAYTDDLKKFISNEFLAGSYPTLDIYSRNIDEILHTGLSRPPQDHSHFHYFMSDFATVSRGIATGANELFLLNNEQVKDLEIPKQFLKYAVGRTRDVSGERITDADVRKLESDERPVYLLSLSGKEELPPAVKNYLQKGEAQKFHERALIKTRNPWYKMEKREVPDLLFAYLGRRNVRFILNEAAVLPLTGFLCVYAKNKDKKHIENLWRALNHPDTIKNLALIGKSYGSGAIKVEPRNLDRLPIPSHVVEKFGLIPIKTINLKTAQASFFDREKDVINA